MNKAFTLVELLVVVTIIVILIAMLMPAMDKAINATELATCAARQHSLLNIFLTYAVENRRKYPSGARDGDGYEHTPWVSHGFVNIIEKAAGNNKGPLTVPTLLNDPSYPVFGGYNAGYGYVIGYQYLGGHPGISKANKPPNYPHWESPISLTNQGSGELITCWNTWAVGGLIDGAWTIVAHLKEGGSLAPGNNGFYQGPGAGGDVVPLGSAGGNIAKADGSVTWKTIERMIETMGDYPKYATAADANGTPNGNYWARW